ncbi:MAG: VWA domain-containing protein [bacterium]|nr:VWA domain-containing protein [bacterium]
MNKRLITIGFLILAITVIGKLLFFAAKSIKVDEFKKAAIIFLIDSSASNQKMLPEEIKFTKSLCTILDPEDQIKILNVSENAYIIYEGSPSDAKGISKSLETFTKYNSQHYGTAYGDGLKKAFEHCLTMKKENYVPSVVVIGDLENEGDVSKQIDWDSLPDNIRNVQKYIPEISMMFVFASPEKLDLVKTKLNPVLGESKLIIANETNIDKASGRYLKAIGR